MIWAPVGSRGAEADDLQVKFERELTVLAFDDESAHEMVTRILAVGRDLSSRGRNGGSADVRDVMGAISGR